MANNDDGRHSGEMDSNVDRTLRRQHEFGLPPIDELLKSHRGAIDRIQLTYGEGRPKFESDLLPAIARYVEFVGPLPATRSTYFCDTGGLARMGLEIGFYALQAADSQIFAGRASITVRRELEPRWRQAAFLAGLCSELFRPFCHYSVTASGASWSPYVVPLTKWARERKTAACVVTWQEAAHEDRYLSVVASQMVIPVSTLQFLTSVEPPIARDMFASIAGVARFHKRNVLDQLVRRAGALVIGRELAHLGGPRLVESAEHWGRHALDVMRYLLVTSPQWQPNAAKSRVWFGQDGLFVLWPNACADIQKTFETFEYVQYPSQAEVLLGILYKADIVAPGSRDDTCWTIRPPDASATFTAIRLRSPHHLLADLPDMPAMLPCSLVVTGRDGTAAPGAGNDLAPAESTSGMSAMPSPRSTGPRPTPPTSVQPASAAPVAPSVVAPALVTVSGEGLSVQEPVTRQDTNFSPHLAPETPDVPGERTDDPARDGVAPAPIRFALNAPLQLPVDIRGALSDIIGSLSALSANCCCTTPHGVFVPLREFDTRGVLPEIATRGLHAAGMLIAYRANQVVVTRDMLGKVVEGIVVDPRYVGGLDPADFTRPS